MSIYDDFLTLLDAAIAQEGNAAKLGECIGINSSMLTRWKTKKRTPSLTSVQPILDYFHARLTCPALSKGKASTVETPLGEGSEDLQACRERIQFLEARVRELDEYRIKWEGHLEYARAQSGLESLRGQNGLEAPVKKTSA